MKLNQLKINNFRCYEDRTFNFHPEVNLIVGQNATGKTALLDAISVAMASWLLGFQNKPDSKSIAPSDVMLSYSKQGEQATYIESWPVTVSARGHVGSKSVSWERSKESPNGNTRYGSATELINIAKDCEKRLTENITLPLISYYGTMRLWQDPRLSKVKAAITKSSKPSRLDGYKHSVDPRIAVRELVKWFAKQEWQSFQVGEESIALRVVRSAILNCIEGASHLRYDVNREELILTLENNDPQPFSVLSDGQRCILALIADIAQKAVTLNPGLEDSVLKETQGIVLIDELDLHLHPRWQRSVIEDLRKTFPQIQFICTTHSPFLIQSLRSNEELIILDGISIAEPANKSIEDIATEMMRVNDPEVSKRYKEMKSVASEYLKVLDEAQMAPKDKLQEYKTKLSESITPYADNPAFQAFLELQRAAKLRE